MNLLVKKRINFKLLIISSAILIQSCNNSNKEINQKSAEIKTEVLTLELTNALIEKSYPAKLEGKNNTQIRPQISGYIDKIFVDEGAYVQAGQPLFHINANVYNEAKNNALASLAIAKASLESAKLDLNKYKTLSDNKVVSDFNYQKAKTNFDNAKANVRQQKTLVSSANINLAFSLVKAPISGYIGRIPNRLGALVGSNDENPLTVISQVDKIYAYFSLSESEILSINSTIEGSNLLDKLKSFKDINLQLADATVYNQIGKIDMVDGQFDANTGSITLRASFPNPEKLLRSGNTGRIILKTTEKNIFRIPIRATYEIQNKLFVGLLDKQNKMHLEGLTNYIKSGDFYIIKSGFKSGDKIIAKELSSIPENTTLKPQLQKQNN